MQPPIELPTHPIADRRRGQQAIMAPGAVELLASLGDRFDAETRAGQTVTGQVVNTHRFTMPGAEGTGK